MTWHLGYGRLGLGLCFSVGVLAVQGDLDGVGDIDARLVGDGGAGEVDGVYRGDRVGVVRPSLNS